MKRFTAIVISVIMLLGALSLTVFAEDAEAASSIPDFTLVNIGISKTGYSLTFLDALIVLLTSVGLSLLIALTYIFTRRKTGISSSMVLTIFVIGTAVASIVLCVGSNTARAISIGGGLAFIRFRNTVDNPKDIMFILVSLAIGVACGIGYIGYALIAAVLFCLILILATLTGFDRVGGKNMQLRILVSESLNYSGVFDPILKEYCSSFNLNKVKLTDYGTVLELDYTIRMKNAEKQKELLDEIRTRNGNLNIILVNGPTE